MKVEEPKTSIGIMVITLAMAVGITALDLLPEVRSIPWHELFVLPVVWIALWSAEDDILSIAAMAMFVTILALLGGWVSHETAAPIPIGDRLIVIAVIWLTVLLALFRKRARRRFKWITLIGRH